jgi:hypothetical protein
VSIFRPSLSLVIIIFAWSLVACTTTRQAEQRVGEAKKALPSPPEATLLAEAIQPASGSQDDCVGAVAVQVFGAQYTFAEVLDFYRSSLVAAGWEPADNSLVAGFTKTDDQLSLSLIPLAPNAGGIYSGRAIQPTLAARQTEFLTFYEVALFFSTCP